MHFHHITPQPILWHWEHFHVNIHPLRDKQGVLGYEQIATGGLAVLSFQAGPGQDSSKETPPKSHPGKEKAWKQEADLTAHGSGDSDASQAQV